MYKNPSSKEGFTLIELLVVIAIIATLAALVLAAARGVQQRGYRAKAEGQIAAIAAALESYKTDNGDYPTMTPVNSNYAAGGQDTATGSNTLTGLNNPLVIALGYGTKVYYEFPSKSLNNVSTSQVTNANGTVTSRAGGTSFLDPWGNNYGYCYNPTFVSSGTSGSCSNGVGAFDLWSTAGQTLDTNSSNNVINPAGWIKNW